MYRNLSKPLYTLFTILIALALSVSVVAQKSVYTVSSIPNSKLECNHCYVSDPDGLLSQEMVNKLNKKLSYLQQQTGVETAIVVVESIGSADYYDFAYKLFNHWKIGDADKNSGLLILLVGDQRAVKVETGLGLEGLLPDATCKIILEEEVFPYFKRGNYDIGFEKFVDSVTQKLTTESAIEELYLNSKSTRNNVVSFITNYFIISIFIFIVLLLLMSRLLNSLTGDNEQRYTRIESPTNIVTIIGLVFPFPPYFLARWLKRKRRALREAPIACSYCEGQMRLLSESEEDPYLKASQITEENLRSVDYDVWLCDHCNRTRIFRYTATSHYSACPQCGALTYKQDDDRVLFRATTLSAGEGVKSYSCKHCKYQNRVHYTIPRIIVASGGFGGSGRGGFGGGGFGGGGFGGGMSGEIGRAHV